MGQLSFGLHGRTEEIKPREFNVNQRMIEELLKNAEENGVFVVEPRKWRFESFYKGQYIRLDNGRIAQIKEVLSGYVLISLLYGRKEMTVKVGYASIDKASKNISKLLVQGDTVYLQGKTSMLGECVFLKSFVKQYERYVYVQKGVKAYVAKESTIYGVSTKIAQINGIRNDFLFESRLIE